MPRRNLYVATFAAPFVPTRVMYFENENMPLARDHVAHCMRDPRFPAQGTSYNVRFVRRLQKDEQPRETMGEVLVEREASRDEAAERAAFALRVAR